MDEHKDESNQKIKRFRKRKIEQTEQDEEAICTISKDRNISNQYLATQ